MNPMQTVHVEKVTLNIGAGKDQTKLEKGMTLLKTITGIPPIKTITNKRIAAWGLRPGLPIGCKITLRKQPALELIKRLLTAKDHKINQRCIDNHGNISFGIPEYIDIPNTAYDPKIGIIGLEVCITLKKPGYRIKYRKLKQKKIPKTHHITKPEAITFLNTTFKTTIEE